MCHYTYYNRIRTCCTKQMFLVVYFVLLIIINESTLKKISESLNNQDDRRGGVKSYLLPAFQLSATFHGRKARIITLAIIFAQDNFVHILTINKNKWSFWSMPETV